MVAVDFCCFGSCLFVIFFGTKPGHQLCVTGMPSPAELKTVGDDSCSTTFSKFLTERHVHIRQQSE